MTHAAEFAELNELRIKLATMEAKENERLAMEAQEEANEWAEAKRTEKIHEAIHKRSNALMREALGAAAWNAMWGPWLERLGDAVDIEVSRTVAAETKLAELEARVKELETELADLKGSVHALST